MARAKTLQEFQQIVGDNIRRRLKPQLVERAEQQFAVAKREMIDDFLNHPISKELIEHTEPSKFLSGSPGSLFGFLGFNAGDDPISDVLEYLKLSIDLRHGARINRYFQLPLYIVMPNKGDFNNDRRFKLPWGSGMSWVVGVELGVSGLPRYLSVSHRQNTGESRSEEGIQVKKNIRNQGYHKRDYLTEIFSKFRRRVIGK